MKALNLADGDEAASIGRDPLKAMCNRLSRFKDSLVTPEEAPARVEAMIAAANHDGTPVDPQGLRACARVYVEYQRVLRDANAADFGDLLLWPTRAMQVNEFYRERWAGRFDCILADEYQDVNHAQYSWLRLLGQNTAKSLPWVTMTRRCCELSGMQAQSAPQSHCHGGSRCPLLPGRATLTSPPNRRAGPG